MKEERYLDRLTNGEKGFLNSYDSSKYEKPSVTVDMLIFTIGEEEKGNYRKLSDKVLKLLLVKRGEHPYKNYWALPGGFVKVDESLEEAALRELKEETNLEDIYMEQLYTWGEVSRDPRTRVISTSYMSLVDSQSLEIKASEDAADAKWFEISCKLYQENKTITESGYILKSLYRLELNNEDIKLFAIIMVKKVINGKHLNITREIVEAEGIAFDHAKIIEYGIDRLHNKIEYTDIAFQLMPEYFTLTELQQVYEIILGSELLKANFRRKISHMVIETNQFTKNAGHRPSKLFKFNPNWSNSIE